MRTFISLIVLAGWFYGVAPACAATAGEPQGGGAARARIADMARDLDQRATAIARDSYDHFRGRDAVITDREQAVLFKSEEFAAACRLFLRLAGGPDDYYRTDTVRTSLYNAFTYLTNAYGALEQEMRQNNVMPYGMSDARSVMNRMDREFRGWAAPDNLAYLDGRYVQANDASVYLIERAGTGGEFRRRPFRNLESLFRYNYDQNRGTDPWKFRVQVGEDMLRKMRVGAPIELTFEGQMVMLQGSGRSRQAYRIENGRKRPFTTPGALNRYGGWNRVFEVPREVIDGYPLGDPMDR